MGGSLVTTIAFGVHASVMMAILLGAFIIQGLVPGPDMLIPEPKGHLALTFSFVWTIIISNIITVVICFLFLKELVKVTYIRGNLLIPFILLLIYLGAFAEKNTFEDLILVLIFGVLGWVLMRLNWPRPPLILGLVLGPLAENRLFLSTDNYGLAWLLRPGVLLIGCLTLAGAFYPIFKARRKKGEVETLSHQTLSHDGRRALRFNWETAFCFFIIVVLALALWHSRHFDFRSGLFPWVVGFPVLALAIIRLVMDLMGKAGETHKDHPTGIGPELQPKVVNRRTAGIFGWTIGYFITIWLLGFSVGVPLCMFAQLKIGSREKWPLSIILTVGAWAFIYLLFYRMLRVPFPQGLIFVWLS